MRAAYNVFRCHWLIWTIAMANITIASVFKCRVHADQRAGAAARGRRGAAGRRGVSIGHLRIADRFQRFRSREMMASCGWPGANRECDTAHIIGPRKFVAFIRSGGKRTRSRSPQHPSVGWRSTEKERPMKKTALIVAMVAAFAATAATAPAQARG